MCKAVAPFDLPLAAATLTMIEPLLARSDTAVHLVEAMGACGFVGVAAAGMHLAGHPCTAFAGLLDDTVRSLIDCVKCVAERNTTNRSALEALFQAHELSDGVFMGDCQADLADWLGRVPALLGKVHLSQGSPPLWTADSVAQMDYQFLSLTATAIENDAEPMRTFGLIRRIILVATHPASPDDACVAYTVDNAGCLKRTDRLQPEPGDAVLILDTAKQHFCVVTVSLV